MRSSSLVLWFVSAFCALLLSGCAGNPTFTANPGSAQTMTLRGSVHGGQQPVVGAHVYLFAISATGWGGPGIAPSSSNASVSLLTSGTARDSSGNWYVTTDSNGQFSITGDYTCPSSANTYYYATGGDSGSGNNSAITLVAPFSSCNPSTFTIVNEVSTIASVFTFAGLITDPLHVGTSGSALALSSLNSANSGLNNILVQGAGVANTTTPSGNGTVPQAEINTLANILASCINSTGPGSVACATLFANAQSGGVTPSDTATAAVNIAHNPGANVAALFALQTPSPPFQPTLTAAPNDFTIAISYTGGGLTGPGSVAIDANGTAWVTNNSARSISAFGADGTVLSPSTGFTTGGLAAPFGIAIDAKGNVWVANNGNLNGSPCNCISEFNSNGVPMSPGTGYSGGGLTLPFAIAIDTAGNAWVTNPTGNSISKFNSSGTALTGSGGITTGGLNSPSYLAIDNSNNVWVSNSSGNSMSEFNSSGTAYPASPFLTGGLNNPKGIAVDASNNIWVASRGNNVLGEFNGSGAVAPSGYSGGGMNQPNYAAVDSAGNIWIANPAGNNISVFNSSGVAISGSGGYQAGLSTPRTLAIDGVGNVWVTNGGNNTVTEFLGVASPVVTPIVANLISPYTHAASRP
jgi:streptogramin lyase